MKSQKMSSVCLLCIVAFLTISAAADEELPSGNTRCSLTPPGECAGDEYSYNCSFSACDAFPSDIDPEVREIRLRGNEIKTLNKTLRNFKQLLMLDLSENKVNAIEAGAFPYALVYLDLSSNDITLDTISSQRVFDNLGKLEYLSLANNKLENLTVQSIFSPWLPKIKHLDLSRNRIESLKHNVLTDMNFLEILDLSDNEISDPDTSDFLGLYRLEVLNMTRNRLEYIPDLMFQGMNTLKTVDLSNNLIGEISERNFERASRLETLHLERNEIRVLPKGLCIYMKSLRSLHLDGNPLKSVESGSLTPTLRTLSIRNCDHLEQVEEAIDGLGSLEEIDISGNGQLYSIADGAFGINGTARSVNLSHNALTTLSEHLLVWDDVTTADLSGNFWDCDCRMLWAKRLPAPSPVRESIRCYSPLHLKGWALDSVNESELSCNVVSRYRRQGAIALAVLFTVVFFGSVALVVRHFRRNLCPSCDPTGKYQTLYSSAEAGADDDANQPVIIKKAYSADTANNDGPVEV